ncbi:hypothetical protein BDV28DRAFT_137271 [Aspergillus coremiiformis]|uniref:Uncharacterized protein n=1 Tax=Aspergillus coremiiformis TaxID=138285 RepID=A0A5N6Z0Z5_9EURO|nr:hypothetical protein BDV28DRAFT_137271 [Aspergillus coremiiformis]
MSQPRCKYSRTWEIPIAEMITRGKALFPLAQGGEYERWWVVSVVDLIERCRSPIVFICQCGLSFFLLLGMVPLALLCLVAPFFFNG